MKISTALLTQVADHVESDASLVTKEDAVRVLRDLALVLDLREFLPEIDIGWPGKGPGTGPVQGAGGS
ncbi:hypothetical protein H9623_08695 [Oerskovia sp. Sa1BUA8]|uniref:Uncharacterized protein n=1 Tax=Oerskovia douganii TaxID=2762210 RepID=A0A9D5UAA7_9CELL|nr:hypothetical protein [Oerskovia douganii]MBE7700381.1 hypothetical protein [Oerskovia douganii]